LSLGRELILGMSTGRYRPSALLLLNHQLVRPTVEDFGGKVLPEFATEGALNGDGLKGELLDARWYVAAASLACDDETLPISGHLEHVSIIGE
jgi:hypothetical protein